MRFKIKNGLKILNWAYVYIFSICLFSTALGQNKDAYYNLNTNSNLIEYFDYRDGLTIKLVKSLLIDDNETVWISGISSYHGNNMLANPQYGIQVFNGVSILNVALPDDDLKSYEIDLVLGKDDVIYASFNKDNDIPKLYKIKTSNFIFEKVALQNLSKGSELKVERSEDGELIVGLRQDKKCEVFRLTNENKLEYKTTLDLEGSLNFTQFIQLRDMMFINNSIDGTQVYNLDDGNTWVPKLVSGSSSINDLDNRDKIESYFIYDDRLVVWINTYSDFFYYDEESHTFKNFTDFSNQFNLDFSKSKIVEINNDEANNFIVQKGLDGVLQFDVFSQNYTTISTKFELFETSNQAVAFNSLNDYVVISGYERLYKISLNNYVANILDGYSIRKIYEQTDNNIIVATELNGWYSIDLENLLTTRIDLKLNGENYIPKLNRNIVFDGSFYWSNDERGIIRIDNDLKTVVQIPSTKRASDFVKLGDWIYYFTDDGELHKLNIKTLENIRLKTFTNLQCQDMLIEGSTIYIGTNNGLIKVIDDVVSFPIDRQNDHSLISLSFTQKYGLLGGTIDGKLVQYDLERSQVKLLYEVESKSSIVSVTSNADLIWIATLSGLMAYSPNLNSETQFGSLDGFNNIEFNRHSNYRTKDNRLILGTFSGLTIFNPNTIMKNKIFSGPDISFITFFDAENKEIENYSSPEVIDRKLEEIVLPASNRSIELGIGLKDGNLSKNLKYRYRLNGGSWSENYLRSTLRLENISYGSNLLELEYTDLAGSPIGTTRNVNIRAQQYFFQSVYFYILLFLVLSGIVIYYLRYLAKLNKMEKIYAEELLTAVDNERLRISSELHDNLGQRISLICRYAKNEKLDELQTLAEESLNSVRTISNNLTPPELDLIGFKASVTELIDKLNRNFSIKFTYEIAEIEPYLNTQEKFNLYRILQELLTNAIKHSKADLVQLKIWKSLDKVYVMVEDNGIGCNLSKLNFSKGVGLRSIKRRTKLLNGELTLDSDIGLGFTARIEIQLKKKVLEQNML